MKSSSGSPPNGNHPSVDADLAIRAKSILRSLQRQPQLIPAWITLNALYAKVGPERHDLMVFIQTYVSDYAATIILRDRAADLNYYATTPPGNMRLGPQHPAFRRRTAEDLAVAADATAPPAARLAHLVAAVYQVRCNLFHGHKDVDNSRDRHLVGAGYRIVNDVLRVVLT